jgi:hypothetical protein
MYNLIQHTFTLPFSHELPLLLSLSAYRLLNHRFAQKHVVGETTGGGGGIVSQHY